MSKKDKQFKMRCSALGTLFTEPRSKSETISATLKTHLNNWYLEKTYGVRTDITSRYTDKGIQLEDEAIREYNKLFKTNHVKNDEYFEDDFIQGTPDIVSDDDDEVLDIKCSFSLSSFPALETKCPNKAYDYQLQGYMRLTGKSKAKLVYVLLDTPDDIIAREAKSIMYKEKLPDDFLDILIEEVKESQTYSHIPMKNRIKVFEVARNEEIIKAIDDKVLAARKYIDSL
jgi:hypothetical protein